MTIVHLPVEFGPAAEGLLNHILAALLKLNSTGGKLMAEIDDLNASNVALTAEVTKVVAGFNTMVGEVKRLSDQLVAAIAANNPVAIKAASDSINAAVAGLETGLNAALASLTPPSPTP